MRTRKRLKGLQTWLKENICQGREMNTAAPNNDITQICRQEPDVYIAWYPGRPDSTTDEMARNVSPGIVLMPAASKYRDMEEKRFDRYNNVRRPQDLGQTLSVQLLFSVYEPGIRLPGFTENPKDMTKLLDGTEEGLFALTDWMDECMEKMAAVRHIPGTDLSLNEASVGYSLYTDQSFVVDKRPLYYGIIVAEFGCYAGTAQNRAVDEFLK